VSLVSIIIPLFNTEQYIEETLHSATQQSYENIEIIVIDDKSTDTGVAKVKQLMLLDNRITLLSNQRSKGVSGARNTGLDYASGEFITFLDSDDTLSKNSIEYRVKAFNDNSDASLICGGFDFIDETSNFIEAYWFQDIIVKEMNQETGYFKLQNPISFFLTKFNMIITNTIMFRKDMIPKFGIFKENMTHSEDEEYWYRIAITGPLVFIPKILASYRKRRDSATTDHTKGFEGRLQHKKLMLESTKFKKFIPEIKTSIKDIYLGYNAKLREDKRFYSAIRLSLQTITLCPTSLAPYKGLIAALLRRT
jgi:glycosyltransferase involved in cell wall biosynthesis